MEKLKYTILIDYVLGILRIARQEKPSMYASLVQTLQIMKQKFTFGEIQELGKYLEARGWAKLVFPWGDVRAQITTAGMVYLDEKKEDFNKEFVEFLGQLHKEKKSEKDLILTLFNETDDPKITIGGLLDNLKEKIQEKEGKGADTIKDLEVIKLELSKNDPDFRLIENKLNNLSKYSFISSEIQELKDYIPV